jgi:hypothetical protein
LECGKNRASMHRILLITVAFFLGAGQPVLAAAPGASKAWTDARVVCTELVLRASILATDPGNLRITAPLNRFLAKARLAHFGKRAVEEQPPADKPGVRVRMAEATDHPAFSQKELAGAISALEAHGGSVFIHSDNQDSSFTVENGVPTLLMSTTSTSPFGIAHELAHFEHWLEIRALLMKEMPEAEAATLSLLLMDTPEGAWLTEQRAIFAQFNAALARGFDENYPGRNRYLSRSSVLNSNYPAQVAMDHTFLYELFIGEKFALDHPELTAEIAEANAKLSSDLIMFVDRTVENTMAQWLREIDARQRFNPVRPTSIREFFGVSSPFLDHSENALVVSAAFEGMSETYLLEGVDRYFLTHPEPVPLPRRRSTASEPTRRRWYHWLWWR